MNEDELKNMRNKKRILLIIGAILFIGAAAAFGISRWYYWRGGAVMDGPGEFYSRMYRMYNRWYYWRGGAVMDGPGEFYSRMYRMYNLFSRTSIGLFVASVVSIALDFLLRIVRRS